MSIIQNGWKRRFAEVDEVVVEAPGGVEYVIAVQDDEVIIVRRQRLSESVTTSFSVYRDVLVNERELD